MTPRRPILGWFAFAMLVAAWLTTAGAVVWGYVRTQDAFLPGPPWFAVSATTGVIPVGALAGLALLLGTIGAARREKPGWPAIAAMILSLPVLGAVAFATFVLTTVSVQCAGPAGACG